MEMNQPKFQETKQDETDERLQEIDRINLQNRDIYKYSIDTGRMLMVNTVETGTLESEDRRSAIDEADFMMDDRDFDTGKYQIIVYEWLPATLTTEGEWVDIREEHNTMDVSKFRGKEVHYIHPIIKQGKEIGTKVMFTDGQYIEFTNPFHGIETFSTPF